jgi:hypothetical protein
MNMRSRLATLEKNRPGDAALGDDSGWVIASADFWRASAPNASPT